MVAMMIGRRRLMLISGVLGLLLWHYFSTFPAQDDNNSGPTLHFGGGNVFEEGNSLLQRYSDAKYEILLDRLLTMEIPHRKAQERNFALKSDLGSSPKPCDIYLFEGKTERAILTNVWEDMTSYDIDDVAIVTQVDQDRLARLQPLLDHWKGTLSVAIYVDLSDTGVFIQNLVKCPSLFWRHNIDLHIVARNEAETFYPVNLLRNVALNNTRAAFVQILDSDLLPSLNMYDVLRSRTNMPHRTKTAVVTPVFDQTNTNMTFPTSKADLIRLWDDGMVEQFYFRQFPAGHSPTVYSKWKHATSFYQIPYKPLYEPYVLVKRSETPPFDERFLGKYRDKVSHGLTLHYEGFQFVVAPNTFLIHHPHPRPKDKVKYLPCARHVYEQLESELQNKQLRT